MLLLYCLERYIDIWRATLHFNNYISGLAWQLGPLVLWHHVDLNNSETLTKALTSAHECTRYIGKHYGIVLQQGGMH